jgi:hypothetical protein
MTNTIKFIFKLWAYEFQNSQWWIPNLYIGMGVSGSEATLQEKSGFDTQESN